MDICMGGRIAEELIFGTDYVTTGASSDFEQATNIARFMVTKCGMSEKVSFSSHVSQWLKSKLNFLVWSPYKIAISGKEKHI